MTTVVPSSRLVDAIHKWHWHPASMVKDLFGVTPDAWQDEVLECFPKTPRIAMLACAGPGKSATLAWLGWNYLLTRRSPWIGVTSITGDNLKSGLAREMAHWYERSPLLKQMFERQQSVICAREEPATWRLEFRTWAKDADASAIGNALRGVHSDYVMWLLDETGDYPDAILPVCENIFAGNPKEAHIVQAGNPSKLGGPLYWAATRRHLWKVVEITADPDDPKRTPRVSIEHARQQITEYGRDNPYVMVNILGKFPPSSFNALIGPAEVDEAMARIKRPDDIHGFAKIMGVDVAAQGDDQSVICPRQGVQVFKFQSVRNFNSINGAGWVARIWNEWDADACFVDNTGGFGAGWCDQLELLRKAPIRVNYSSNASQNDRYFNKRAEMADTAVHWIRNGGALPVCPELKAALTQTTYTHKGNRMLLEPKTDVKGKIGYSPDHFDSFIQTFCDPVSPRERVVSRRPSAPEQYDPFRSLGETVDAARGRYDPFSTPFG